MIFFFQRRAHISQRLVTTKAFLMDIGFLCQRRPVSSKWLLLIPPDACKVVSGVRLMLLAILVQSGHSYNSAILALICVPGISWSSTMVDSSFCDPLLPISSNYHNAPTEVETYTPD